MTLPSELYDVEILHHIANSVESYIDGDNLLEFGAPTVNGNELHITVSDVHDEWPDQKWVLKIERLP